MLEIAEENYTMRELTIQQQQQQQGRMFSSQTKDSPTTYFQNTRREVVSSRPEPSNLKNSNYQSRPSQFQTRPPPPPQERPLPPGDPMDVDQLRCNKNAGSKVRCYKCRQFGHMWKNCPVKNVRKLSEEAINEILEQHWLAQPEREEFDISKIYTQESMDPVPELEEEPYTPSDFQ